MRIKLNTLIEIEWIDASTSQGWRSPSNLDRICGLANCRTVGYFYEQNKDAIKLSKSIDDQECDRLDTQAIPINCVKKIHRLVRKKV